MTWLGFYSERKEFATVKATGETSFRDYLRCVRGLAKTMVSWLTRDQVCLLAASTKTNSRLSTRRAYLGSKMRGRFDKT